MQILLYDIYEDMKHIRLFENFEDDLSPVTRDLFNLTAKIELQDGQSCLKGPVEHKEEAQKIADYIDQQLEDAYDQYDNLKSEARSLQAVEERLEELREELAEDLAKIGYSIEEDDD
jgi:hypothetical protein